MYKDSPILIGTIVQWLICSKVALLKHLLLEMFDIICQFYHISYFNIGLYFQMAYHISITHEI